eukprot:1551453-Rhodomonas_salina.1
MSVAEMMKRWNKTQEAVKTAQEEGVVLKKHWYVAGIRKRSALAYRCRRSRGRWRRWSEPARRSSPQARCSPAHRTSTCAARQHSHHSKLLSSTKNAAQLGMTAFKWVPQSWWRRRSRRRRGARRRGRKPF